MAAASRSVQLKGRGVSRPVEDNLRTLGRDHLDVVNLRRLEVGPGVSAEGDQIVNLDDQLAVMTTMRDESLIGAIGLSAPSKRSTMVAVALAIVFGAFQPASGAAFTWSATRRTTANFVAFLELTDTWVDPDVERIYSILDHLSAHCATDVLLFALAHPRRELVFQPKYAAYLNLIEPWWKILRSLALKGRRFETWEETCTAVAAATVYWNTHRHPFQWGHRRRHHPRRQPGIALLPPVA